jgi:uncharacterized membrane protein
MQKKLHRLLFGMRASALAWNAAVLMFVALPLASLSIDVTRAMYVRTHLQAAADAACQAAANSLDVPAFRDTGVQQIDYDLGRSRAGQVFYNTLRDAGQVRFSPSLSVGYLSPTVAWCSASAPVDRFLPGTPEMTPLVETTSEMRVSQEH